MVDGVHNSLRTRLPTQRVWKSGTETVYTATVLLVSLGPGNEASSRCTQLLVSVSYCVNVVVGATKVAVYTPCTQLLLSMW